VISCVLDCVIKGAETSVVLNKPTDRSEIM